MFSVCANPECQALESGGAAASSLQGDGGNIGFRVHLAGVQSF
jgi:hypothetical protein